MNGRHVNILTSTVLAEDGAATYHGRLVLESFPLLYRSVEKQAGTDAAGLFAIPEAAYSKTRQATVVTWYSDRPGSFRSLDALSQEELAAAETQLAARLHDLVVHADPATRELLACALNVPAPEDIHFNGENIVLTRWGCLDGGDVGGALRPYLPADFQLLRNLSERVEAPPAAAGLSPSAPSLLGMEAEPAAPTASGQATVLPAAPVPAAPEPQPAASRADWPLLMPQIAAIAALVLFLVYILWPGNLVYPPAPAGPVGEAAALDALRASNDATAENIRRLQTALQADICAAEDTALDRIVGLPDMAAIPGPGGRAAPDAAAPPGPLPALGSPEPSKPAAPSTAPGSERSLLHRLDQGTVFVIGETPDGVAMGSGFLVTPEHVLTNYHVVEEVQGNLNITSQSSGGLVGAQVVARSPNSDVTNSDFALLRLSHPLDLPRLPLNTGIERLDSVVASGYPSFVISSDPSFLAAFRDDDFSRLANLQLAVTRGEITAKQPGPTGTTLLAHSATISSGNSGGPLVDACGRVVGVNTYTRTDAENSLRLNFALSAQDAIAFLRQNGVEPSVDPAPCAAGSPGPPVAANTPPPVEGAPPAPAASPAPPPAQGAASQPAPRPPAAPAVPGSDTGSLPVPTPGNSVP
ncbi:S1C family serine protease [Ancylobacter sp. IITR112]|uniref:S1C family serine protease n=1 Tax=Ancylobacter sp. IITR112 TaxID=3138073 RepID=UPI00352BA7DC